MYDQIREDTLYIILYAMVTAVAMMVSCYLLFRRSNAIVPDITSSVRLRRWTDKNPRPSERHLGGHHGAAGRQAQCISVPASKSLTQEVTLLPVRCLKAGAKVL